MDLVLGAIAGDRGRIGRGWFLDLWRGMVVRRRLGRCWPDEGAASSDRQAR
jgi:hypothetical protein